MKSLFIFFVCICTYLSAGISQEAEKIYVKYSEIIISDNCISILMENELCEFSALMNDEKGFYVLLSDKVDWRCPYCNHTNNNDAQYCRKCGRW